MVKAQKSFDDYFIPYNHTLSNLRIELVFKLKDEQSKLNKKRLLKLIEEDFKAENGFIESFALETIDTDIPEYIEEWTEHFDLSIKNRKIDWEKVPYEYMDTVMEDGKKVQKLKVRFDEHTYYSDAIHIEIPLKLKEDSILSKKVISKIKFEKKTQDMIDEIGFPVEFQLIIKELIEANVKFIRRFRGGNIHLTYNTMFFRSESGENCSEIRVDVFKETSIMKACIDDKVVDFERESFKYQFDCKELKTLQGTDLDSFRTAFCNIKAIHKK